VPALPRFALLISSLVSTAGCATADSSRSKEQSARQVDALLGRCDALEVPASALTAFPWQRLCFERDEALLLKFTVDGHERVLALPCNENAAAVAGRGAVVQLRARPVTAARSAPWCAAARTR
jgi:hypothetical protein